MRIAAVGLLLASLSSVPLIAFSACNGATTAGSPDASGSTTPSQDGAVCACATPDCLPNCSDLPACKVVCEEGGTRDWIDPCGNVDYAQACPNGCTDAGLDAQCD
jgi:hypothetical protein